jgi:hypothetical protein
MSKRVALLGFYVGDQYFEQFSKDDPFPQVAAYKLESRFRQALNVGGRLPVLLFQLTRETKRCTFQVRTL